LLLRLKLFCHFFGYHPETATIFGLTSRCMK